MISSTRPATVGAVVAVALLVVVQIDAVDRALSSFFATVLPIVAGMAVVAWLGMELRDWLEWMGVTQPVRVEKRAGGRESVEEEAGR